MEKMPFQPELERAADHGDPTAPRRSTTSDWRAGLPVLAGSNFTLRELRIEDAPSLLAMLTTEEVARFISPPPTTVEGFERFIAWTHRERETGNYVCFGVVPAGHDDGGRPLPGALARARLRHRANGASRSARRSGAPGVFAEGARLVARVSRSTCVGVQRLEARAAVANGRGNGALRKIGAVQEGVLRRSFLRNGQYHDQVLWSILAEDWRAQRIGQPAGVVH